MSFLSGNKHPNFKHGHTGQRIHDIWTSMIARCTNPNSSGYHKYGGRGITVCPEWLKAEAFIAWAHTAGYDDTLQIDRIDNNNGYSPENCRWVTCRTNNRNRRSTRMLTAFGETKCVTEWAEDTRCRVPRTTLVSRLNSGLSAEEAITSAPGPTSRKQSQTDDFHIEILACDQCDGTGRVPVEGVAA